MPAGSVLQNLLRDGSLPNVYNTSSLVASFGHCEAYLLSLSSSVSQFLNSNMSALPSSLRSAIKAVFQYSHIAFIFSQSSVRGGSPPVCSNPQLSCQNTTAVQDSCCFNAPGGQLLQTQFWDTNPPTGPDNSWTVHGLWFVSLSRLK